MDLDVEMDEQELKQSLRSQLSAAINKVPERINSGAVQETRNWMRTRNDAAKVLKKSNATVAQLMSAIESVK
jgi:hypothetical protein